MYPFDASFEKWYEKGGLGIKNFKDKGKITLSLKNST